MIEWVNGISGEFLAYFQLSVLQNSLFLLLILGLLWVFRKKSASLLSLIALIGVSKLLLPPMFDLPALSRQIEPSLLSLAVDSLPKLEVSRASSGSPSVQTFLFTGWLAVALALFLGPLLKTAILMRKFSGARPIDITGYRSLGIPKNVSVVQSHFNHTPLVLGFARQKIILPKDWDNWSSECGKVVLAHELAHIRHRDHWVRLLQLLARSLYFINPLVYLINLLLNRYRFLHPRQPSRNGSSISFLIATMR
jgi:beta-lactamase regulating signal transducer with metallopeptidase domain